MDTWLDETQVAFEEYSDQSLHSGELYSYRFIINLGQHYLFVQYYHLNKAKLLIKCIGSNDYISVVLAFSCVLCD